MSIPPVKPKSEAIQELIIKVLETYADDENPELFATDILKFYNVEAPKYGLVEMSPSNIHYHLGIMRKTGVVIRGRDYVTSKGHPYKLPERATPVDLGEDVVTFLGGTDTPVNLFNRLSVADKSTKYPVDTWNKLRAGFMLLMLSEDENITFNPEDYREELRAIRDVYVEQVQFLTGMLNDPIWAKSSLRKLRHHFDFLSSPMKTDEVNRILHKLYNNEITSLEEKDAA